VNDHRQNCGAGLETLRYRVNADWADFHGLFSRRFTRIIFSLICADQRILSAMICENFFLTPVEKKPGLKSQVRSKKSQVSRDKEEVRRAKVEVRRAKFIDCIESVNLISSLCWVLH
jgi:hypothetical protein